MATIVAGVDSKQEKLVVHQALLCDRSKYFAKALTGSFKESKTGIVKLKDVSRVLFKIIVSWLYSGKIFYADDGSDIDHDFARFVYDEEADRESIEAEDTATWPKQVLLELYVLADRLDMKALRVDTIDALITSMKFSKTTTLERESYQFIDSNTTAESSLRKFAIDLLAYRTRHSTLHLEFWQDIPQEMALTALLLNCQRAPNTLCDSCYQRGLSRNKVPLADDRPCKYREERSFKVDACNYHEHADEEEKKACQASCAKTTNN